MHSHEPQSPGVQNEPNSDLIRFGPFELKPSTAELRKHGIKVRLQNKPVQLLQALLDRPGEVVTREELQHRLWPADTMVDFESGLNTAANRLRLALGDSPDRPLYIETLARIGYRFLAPVEHGVLAIVEPPPIPAPLVEVTPEAAAVPRRSNGWLFAAGLSLLAGVVLILALRARSPLLPTFHQLTFRRMTITSGRFTADGESVIYDGREKTGGGEIYLTSLTSPESRSLGFTRSRLASVSRSGELALLAYDGHTGAPNLLRVPLHGGAPMVLDKNVGAADWTPDGSAMAVIRPGPYPTTVEFPRGKVLYKGSGWISDLRVSPSGREIAFLEHPVHGDDAGMVKLVQTDGSSRTLSEGWSSVEGLAWAPSGREVWFTAARSGLNRSLLAVDLSGRLRPIASFPAPLTLFDISRRGNVLVARSEARMAISGMVNGEATERDLSWFDWSRAVDMSDDGRVVLFDETGEGGGPQYSVYARNTSATSPVRVGNGSAMAISPDGEWAITSGATDRTRLTLVPLSPGQPRNLSGFGLQYEWVRFFPDGQRLLIGGVLPNGKPRLYTQTVDGARPQPLPLSEYVHNAAISPDGKRVAGCDSQKRLVILPLDGSQGAKIIEMSFGPMVSRWTDSGKSLLVQNSTVTPAELLKVDIETAKSQLWKKLAPADLAGVNVIGSAFVSRDMKTYIYSYNRELTELFLVEGLR